MRNRINSEHGGLGGGTAIHYGETCTQDELQGYRSDIYNTDMDSNQGEIIALTCVTNCNCRDVEKDDRIESELTLFILIALVAWVFASAMIPTLIAMQGIIMKGDDRC